jgi:peptidyl-prolyl cis-trans isomerase B (cyclophilin B)
VSPNARERARAKRRYVKRQANLAARQRARRQRAQVLGAVLGVLLIIGGIFALTTLTNKSAKKKTPVASSTPSATASASATPTTAAKGACPASTLKPVTSPQKFTTVPPKSLAKGRDWTATVATTCGTMTIHLDGKAAPQAVASFIFLSQKKFFTGTPCHRVTTSGLFVLQCGDPTGTGSGTPGYSFGVENAPKSGDYPAGTLAMANTGQPNSNGSQFFIVYKDTQLPTTSGGYTIFGTVTKGLDVVDKVAAAGVQGGGTDGAPATPISITGVSVK